tara:strand:- start:4233 stop:4334 length:102 start_codon:yes stop_codon:yes gene_type:complete
MKNFQKNPKYYEIKDVFCIEAIFDEKLQKLNYL